MKEEEAKKIENPEEEILNPQDSEQVEGGRSITMDQFQGVDDTNLGDCHNCR